MTRGSLESAAAAVYYVKSLESRTFAGDSSARDDISSVKLQHVADVTALATR